MGCVALFANVAFYGGHKSQIVKLPLPNQEQHIDQIFRSGVHAIAARQRVRVHFLCKLLLSRNDRK
jgi:hypothetical protein